MRFTEALSQISEIHEHLAKGEVYRGFRSLPVALSGACGLLAASLQPRLMTVGEPMVAVVYWLMVAAIGGVVGGSEMVYNYLFRDDPFARRRTRKVLGQFVPCLAAGAGVTVGLVRAGHELIPFLPGLWSILFGLGIFAARPYLPRAIGWVALFYLGAGVQLLLSARDAENFSGWALGGTFGAGQLAAALVLYWNLERKDHG
ncbi:MAG TPA: hypothetical protein VGZ22_12360 [Isosphaeraceae bacterium]|nr:hypothetical protein [Isosphaeraceae bacterium]